MTRASQQDPPDAVVRAAERRSEARASRDWATADELRADIEAAGWRVTDSGTEFRLEPAHPADQEVGGEIRYGRSDAVPSVLGEPPTTAATIVLPVAPGDPAAVETVRETVRHLPDRVTLVVVGDRIDDEVASRLRGELQDGPGAERRELIRTSAPLGRAAVLNAGIRRAAGDVVIILDVSVRPTGDIVTPLVEALRDQDVAIAGPFGLATGDLRRFEEVVPPRAGTADAAAIQGYCMAFRRSDFVERGPFDEGFRFYRNLDIWWSLVLRDAGAGERPRRAVVVPHLPLGRDDPWAWTATPEPERERLSKRNFYRVLDRFRTRSDLAVPAPGASTGR